MILNCVLWLPGLLLARLLRPVREMVETMADNAEAAIKQYEEEQAL